jgi:hypothetical protein
MTTNKVNCKHEEYVPVMELAWQSIIRDKDEFTLFSPIYNEKFFDDKGKEIKGLKLLLNPRVMEAEGKEITQELIKKMEAFRPKLNFLESYVIKAVGSLTAAPADFGFSTIRENISSHNKEGVVEYMEILLQLVVRNQEAIRSKGFTEAAQTELETATKELESNSLHKGQQIQDTAKLVKKYNKEAKTLLSEIIGICKDGKIIFAKKAPEKVKDFTFAQILKLVRAAAKNDETPPTPTTGK